jgi:hypothetical protein
MKPNNMTSYFAKSVAVLAACAALNVSAGTAPAKNPAPIEPEPSTLFDSIGATLDVAYDSRYYFRGLWFADNIVTTAFNLAIPLVGGSGEDGAGAITWGLGAAYISTVETPTNIPGAIPTSFDYSEIDLVTSLSYNAGWAKFGVQYQYYFYPDTYAGSTSLGPNGGADPEFGIKGAGELGLTVAVPLGAANLYGGYYYDFRVGGSYFQAAADYTVAVNDWLSIVPAIQTGYGIDYYTGNGSALTNNVGLPLAGAPTSGFTHLLCSVSAPVKLTKTATFTPYVAWNHSFDLRTGLNFTTHNEVFWGAKLSIAF